MTEEKRQKSGAQIDKNERIFLERLNRAENNMALLLKDMDKSEHMKGSDMKEYVRITRDCYVSIQKILKKKSMNFKVN